MADILDTPLDEKTLQSLLATLITHKLTSQMQQEDPLRKAQLEHLNVQTQGLRDANDPAKLLEALTGGAGGGSAAPTFNPATPLAGATSFLPNGSYISGTSGPGQSPGYNPPTEYNLDSNPYSADMGKLTKTSKNPASPGADVLIRGKNPATGNPWFGNQLPEWASPEARSQLAADQAATQQTNNGTTGKANEGAGTIPPQELVAMTVMAKTMKQHGFPAEVIQSTLENKFPWLKEQKVAANLEKKQSEADIRKAAAPAPAGTYLDEQGQQYNPLYGGDVTKGSTFYKKGSTQEALFDSSSMINTHVDRTLNALQSVAPGDRNRLSQMLNTKLSNLQNNPDIGVLVDLLSPATALAVSKAYGSGGQRGGVRMAEMFKNSVYSEGDTLGRALTKLKNLEQIILAGAEDHKLHPQVVDSIKQRISTIDDLLKGTGKGAAADATNSEGWITSGGIQYKPKGK